MDHGSLKERPFNSNKVIDNKSQSNFFSTISTLNIDDHHVDDIDIMVQIPNPDIVLNDFQRISTNRNDSDVQKRRLDLNDFFQYD